MTDTNTNIKGDLTYDSKVVQKIVGIALSDIKGLLTVDGGFFSNLTDKLVNNDDVTSGINVDVGKKQVAVDIDIVAEYGIDIAKLYDQIKSEIARKVKSMTDLDVIEVNVTVVDVKTKKEHDKDSISIQDRITGATKEAKKNVDKNKEKHAEQRVQ
ncbi:Asp23/Gls24 family envelope stress response protein [Bombilactobacillus thymidiniphilus]|uniref:Stress response regulator gls24 homolog n=1 Tax=Bombilactobacillus thymidiniphilus TaxID=2923363 RepID=A0ABY4PFH3_9LACO|nr:Asp23/Gls24 family envelope stress response protein [Bombilactobacillus thymidiniphilus]UQS84253.1 Asp23/Gls24 family envelope stress response protein [Bombilactobacillus thymidiniphilus]